MFEDFKPQEYTIVLADDNPENLSVLTAILEHSGYETRAALNGEEVLKRVEYEIPDLILLDVHMPKIDGFEACRRILAMEGCADVPILFISALNDSFNRVQGFEAGGRDFISKPFDSREVLARVRTHILLKDRTTALETSLKRLKSLQDSLVAVEKQSYLGTLVAKLAHQINSPLGNALLAQSSAATMIQTKQASGLGLDPKETGRMGEFLDQSLRSLERIRALTSRFTMLGTDFEGSVEKLNILDAAKDIVTLAGPTMDTAGVEVELDIPHDLEWPINFQALLRMLHALIENSIKHSNKEPADLKMCLEARETPKGLSLVFRDNGVGIKDDLTDRVFDPFFTTGSKNEDLGLGLHLAFLIATQTFGGSIRAVPSNDGARFEVFLPTV